MEVLKVTIFLCTIIQLVYADYQKPDTEAEKFRPASSHLRPASARIVDSNSFNKDKRESQPAAKTPGSQDHRIRETIESVRNKIRRQSVVKNSSLKDVENAFSRKDLRDFFDANGLCDLIDESSNEASLKNYLCYSSGINESGENDYSVGDNFDYERYRKANEIVKNRIWQFLTGQDSSSNYPNASSRKNLREFFTTNGLCNLFDASSYEVLKSFVCGPSNVRAISSRQVSSNSDFINNEPNDDENPATEVNLTEQRERYREADELIQSKIRQFLAIQQIPTSDFESISITKELREFFKVNSLCNLLDGSSYEIIKTFLCEWPSNPKASVSSETPLPAFITPPTTVRNFKPNFNKDDLEALFYDPSRPDYNLQLRICDAVGTIRKGIIQLLTAVRFSPQPEVTTASAVDENTISNTAGASGLPDITTFPIVNIFNRSSKVNGKKTETKKALSVTINDNGNLRTFYFDA